MSVIFGLTKLNAGNVCVNTELAQDRLHDLKTVDEQIGEFSK